MIRTRATAGLALLAGLLLLGCASAPCDELAGLRAERDRAREAYAELSRAGTTTPQDGEAADAAVHELDRQVFDLERSCGR